MIMRNFNIQITIDGRYTCDAVAVVTDEKNTFVDPCPSFNDLADLMKWIQNNKDYIV